MTQKKLKTILEYNKIDGKIADLPKDDMPMGANPMMEG